MRGHDHPSRQHAQDPSSTPAWTHPGTLGRAGGLALFLQHITRAAVVRDSPPRLASSGWDIPRTKRSFGEVTSMYQPWNFQRWYLRSKGPSLGGRSFGTSPGVRVLRSLPRAGGASGVGGTWAT